MRSQPLKEYKGYDLREIPLAARPDPTRCHRGEHSYTVKVDVQDATGQTHEAVVDVLLRKRAFCIKKCGSVGRRGQISWKKSGSVGAAWSITIDQAACGATM